MLPTAAEVGKRNLFFSINYLHYANFWQKRNRLQQSFLQPAFVTRIENLCTFRKDASEDASEDAGTLVDGSSLLRGHDSAPG
jgi:hypothetical protein